MRRQSLCRLQLYTLGYTVGLRRDELHADTALNENHFRSPTQTSHLRRQNEMNWAAANGAASLTAGCSGGAAEENAWRRSRWTCCSNPFGLFFTRISGLQLETGRPHHPACPTARFQGHFLGTDMPRWTPPTKPLADPSRNDFLRWSSAAPAVAFCGAVELRYLS